MSKTLAALALLAQAATVAVAQSQGTAFTYQGRLSDGGAPASGPFDFRFTLYGLPVGGSPVGSVVDRDDVPVVEGGFTLSLDFGEQAFVGAQRFLEVEVRPGASTGAFTPLGPRQELTPVPAAMYSAGAPWSGVAGKPPGFADDEDDDAIGALSCAADQIPRWGGASWFCSEDEGAVYTAGGGLELVQGTLFIIADGGVTQTKLGDGAVVESKLANASVTGPKLAGGAVDTAKLADLSVTTSKIELGAVTTAQIAQGTISFADLGQNGCALDQVIKHNGAVWGCGTDANTTYAAGTGLNLAGTTFDLADGGVTSTQIANGSIAFADLGGNGCLVDQVIKWNGAAWTCAADGGAGENHDHLGEAWSGSAATGLALATSGGTGLAARTDSDASGSRGLFGLATSGTGEVVGVHGQTASSTGAGVLGVSTDPSLSARAPGVLGRTASLASAGVEGVATATNGVGAGVLGRSEGLFAGVFGVSATYGVVGQSTSTDQLGLYPGVYGVSGVQNGRGVAGSTDSYGADGVYGENGATTGNGTGGYFVAQSQYGTGAFGWAQGPTHPDGLQSTGVWGRADSAFGRGVYGEATATSGPAIGVWGVTASTAGHAGYFEGNVEVTGVVTRPAGLVKIDHPTDPENRYFVHAAVASSEHKNFYDGVVVTDGSGYGVVELPPWFEEMNRDFRYQLTVLDEGDHPGFVQAKVVRKIAAGRFAVRTSAPRVEVSWMVTGIRRDRFAQRHPVVVEADKPVAERGTYLHAAEWDQPLSKDRRTRAHAEVRP